MIIFVYFYLLLRFLSYVFGCEIVFTEETSKESHERIEKQKTKTQAKTIVNKILNRLNRDEPLERDDVWWLRRVRKEYPDAFREGRGKPLKEVLKEIDEYIEGEIEDLVKAGKRSVPPRPPVPLFNDGDKNESSSQSSEPQVSSSQSSPSQPSPSQPLPSNIDDYADLSQDMPDYYNED